MRIASPDTLAYETLDALAALPQRDGVPLPALIAPFRFVGAAGFALAAAGTLGTGEPVFGVLWIAMAVMHGFRGAADYRRLQGEVATWSPEKAREYRAKAYFQRERYVWMRTSALMIGLVLVVSTTMLLDVLPSYLIPFGFLVALLGFTGDMYSECLMPRDPDLRQPVPSPT